MKINSINNEYKIINHNSTSTIDKSLEYDSTNFNKTDMSYFNQDSIDYDKLTKLTLENLRQSYKGVNIYVVNSNDNKDINKLALGLGNGKHLVITKDFINKMSSSAEAYDKGKKILEETLKQLSNSEFNFKSTGAYLDEKGITFWNTYEKINPVNTSHNSYFEAMKKMQEQIDKLQNKFKVMNSNSALNAPVEIYSKLAKARSVAEVKSVASAARFKINKLKSMLRDCEDDEKIKINAAIRQLEKAITRSYRKVRDLSQENNLANERITAEINDKKSLVHQKKNELNRRRAIRHVRERAQIDEANPLYYYPQILLNKKNNDLKDEDIPTIDISGLYVNISPQVEAITVETAVNVMPTVEISI